MAEQRTFLSNSMLSSDRVPSRARSDASLIHAAAAAHRRTVSEELESFSSVDLPPYRAPSTSVARRPVSHRHPEGAGASMSPPTRRRRSQSDPEPPSRQVSGALEPAAHETDGRTGWEAKIEELNREVQQMGRQQRTDAARRDTKDHVSLQTPLYETAVVLDESAVRRLTELNDVDLSFQDSEASLEDDDREDHEDHNDPSAHESILHHAVPIQPQVTVGRPTFNFADYTLDLDALNQSTCGGRDQFAMQKSSEVNAVPPTRLRPRVSSVDSGPSDFTADLVNYMNGSREAKPVDHANNAQSTEDGAAEYKNERSSAQATQAQTMEARTPAANHQLDKVLRDNARLSDLVQSLESELLDLRQMSAHKYSTPITTTDPGLYEARTMELTQANELLTKTLTETTDRASSLAARHDAVQLTNDQLARGKQELAARAESLATRVDELTAEKNELRSSLSEASQRIAALEGQVDALTATHEELRFSSNALAIEKQTLEDRVAALARTNEQLGHANEEIAQDATALETQVADETSARTALAAQAAEQAAALTELKEQLAGKTSTITALETQLTTKTPAVASLEKKLLKQASAITALEKQLAAARAAPPPPPPPPPARPRPAERDRFTTALARLAAAEQQLADERDQAAAARRNLAALQQTHDAARTAWATARQELEAAHADERLALLEQMADMRTLLNKLGKRMLWEWGAREVGRVALPTADGAVRTGMGYRYQTR